MSRPDPRLRLGLDREADVGAGDQRQQQCRELAEPQLRDQPIRRGRGNGGPCGPRTRSGRRRVPERRQRRCEPRRSLGSFAATRARHGRQYSRGARRAERGSPGRRFRVQGSGFKVQGSRFTRFGSGFSRSDGQRSRSGKREAGSGKRRSWKRGSGKLEAGSWKPEAVIYSRVPYPHDSAGSDPARMRAVDLIRHKRDGGALDRADIESFVTAVTDGTLPDYQTSALLMAICIRGMTAEETAALTDAMVRSGVRVDVSGHRRRAGRQAQHRRRRRQDVADPGAARRGVRRGRADDVGPRPRAHRRHARQARGDPRIPHRPVARRAARGGGDDRLRDDRPDRRDRAGRPQALRAARRDRHGREHPAHLARRS